MIVDLQTKARRVGNSWAIFIPKDKADEINLTAETNLQVGISPIAKLKDIAGTFRAKKSTAQMMREIDKGWD